MRLELKQLAGEKAGEKWFFERGQRSLGRSADCDWQMPEQQRRVSKVHCIIERDRDGFLLRDRSANGSRVDNRVVFEGETARLADRSRIEFGGLVFIVSISGEPDRDIEDPDAGLVLSDENLTISSILADVAPGGRTASGILGERVGGDWLGGSPERARAEGAAGSRNVEIGWDGPPETTGMKSLLPDDWNADFDYGSQLEHGSAMRVSVPVSRSRTPADGDDAARTIIAANDATASDLLERGRRPDDGNHLLHGLDALVGELEVALSDGLSIFGIDDLPLGGQAAVLGSSHEARIVDRLTALLLRQVRFNSLLENLMREAGQTLEPRVIEARVDATSRRLTWPGKRGYWQVYRERFERDGKTLSIRDVFREAMLAPTDDAKNPDAEGIAERKNSTR